MILETRKCPSSESNGVPGSLWYAVYVRSNAEQKVAEALAAKNLPIFAPVNREVHAWKDRRKIVRRPLFPGYIFAQFASFSPDRVGVLRTEGVVKILGSANSPEPVPEWEIESLRKMVGSDLPLETHELLREGAQVHVRRGALKGLCGILLRIKGGTRIAVSIELLSRSVSTEIDLSDVEVIPSRQLFAPRHPKFQMDELRAEAS